MGSARFTALTYPLSRPRERGRSFPRHSQQSRPGTSSAGICRGCVGARYAHLLAAAGRPCRGKPSPMAMDTIHIRGARTHNLKNFDLDLPRDRLIVILPACPVRASPRSPFDTIYAEGQRRCVESLSATRASS